MICFNMNELLFIGEGLGLTNVSSTTSIKDGLNHNNLDRKAVREWSEIKPISGKNGFCEPDLGENIKTESSTNGK